MNSIWFLLISYIFYLVMACQPKEKLTPSPEFLFGKWLEKESEEIIQFGGTNHIFEFTEDQFFLKFRYWTDGLTGDKCMDGYTAYFKGDGAEIIGDSIRIVGEATNENFEFITAEYDRSISFQETYKFKTESEEVLILNSDSQTYNQIRLEKE